MLLAALLALPALAASPVEVEVVDGPRPAIRVRAVSGRVHLPACRGVVWERYDPDAGAMVPVDRSPCGPAEPAIAVDREGVVFELPEGARASVAVHPVLVVGLGCEDGVPFELARCRGIVEVSGPQVRVRPR